MATTHRLADRSQNRPLRIAMVLPPWLPVPPPGYGGVEHVVAGLVDAIDHRDNLVRPVAEDGDPVLVHEQTGHRQPETAGATDHHQVSGNHVPPAVVARERMWLPARASSTPRAAAPNAAVGPDA